MMSVQKPSKPPKLEIDRLEDGHVGHPFKLQPAASLKVAVIKRILNEVQTVGTTNRTRLAGRCGMNYASCAVYVNALVVFDWLRVVSANKVAITETGINVKKRLEVYQIC